MSLDIHIGKTEDKASTTEPIASMDESIHTNIFCENKHIFTDNNLIIFSNLFDFHSLYSPFIVHNNDFENFKKEISILKLNIDKFNLENKSIKYFKDLLDKLEKITRNNRNDNIYFAFD